MRETPATAMGTRPGVAAGPAGALYQFVGAFVDELSLSGVRRVCLCPGSRSTPLALLLRKHPAIRVWTHLDERSAAFFALGMAKASREPVAVLSTSGTAAVNFAPAVVEASYAGVPLIVLTADRPPELRDVGANQTIDQVRLYGSHVRSFVEMLLPEATEGAVRHARTTACRAVATACSERPGPVHLNFPFREPLIPVGEGRRDLARRRVAGDGAGEQPYVSIDTTPRRPEPETVAALAARLAAAERGLIVCGPQDDPGLPSAVVRLAKAADVPVLADPLSQARCGSHHGPQVIDSYDSFLRDQAIAADLAPHWVLRFGAAPVSKPLMQYLQQHADVPQVMVEAGQGWSEPLLVSSDVIRAHPASVCEALADALGERRPGPRDGAAVRWLQRWQELQVKARDTLRERLRAGPDMSEARAFAELADLLPEGATLFAGNSMPVRDLDAFFPGTSRSIRMLANRGASGIDGVVSAALGASTAGPGPLVLVIGDLSFYHDLNGLLAAKRHGLRATIILLNNDGGGIFSFLPQADETEFFEELFGTPHGLDFSHAAAMYGVGFQRASSWEEFRAAVGASLDSRGVSVIEVRTDRSSNVEQHRSIWEAVSRALH